MARCSRKMYRTKRKPCFSTMNFGRYPRRTAAVLYFNRKAISGPSGDGLTTDTGEYLLTDSGDYLIQD